MTAEPETGTPECFELRELIAEAERELALRRRVYPRWVRGGRMTEAQASRRIALMEAIIRRLRGAADR